MALVMVDLPEPSAPRNAMMTPPRGLENRTIWRRPNRRERKPAQRACHSRLHRRRVASPEEQVR